MSTAEIVLKVREHLGKTKSAALMMAHAQSSLDRERHLRDVSAEIKKASALLEKLENKE